MAKRVAYSKVSSVDALRAAGVRIKGVEELAQLVTDVLKQFAASPVSLLLFASRSGLLIVVVSHSEVVTSAVQFRLSCAVQGGGVRMRA